MDKNKLILEKIHSISAVGIALLKDGKFETKEKEDWIVCAVDLIREYLEELTQSSS